MSTRPTLYVVVTKTGFICGLFANRKDAEFAARMHNTNKPDDAARVSCEPVIGY